MVRIRPRLLGILLLASLVATTGLHPAAMAKGETDSQVLTSEHHGCATTTCPKIGDVFGLVVQIPACDPEGSDWISPSPPPFFSWILPVPHVGRAPPSVRT